jgi:hypothetical protein
VLLAFLLLWCVQAVLVEMRAQGCTTADDHNHYLTAALNSSNKHVGKYRSALLRECLLDMLKEGFALEDSSFVRVMEVWILHSLTLLTLIGMYQLILQLLSFNG